MAKLSSKWDGVSPHLLASFFKVKHHGINDWRQDESSDIVVAPLTESNLEVSMTWQSPFENQSLDAQAPFFSAMLQSGGFTPILTAFAEKLKDVKAGGETLQSSSEYLEKGRGRASITRLNSTQIFSGMPPAKLTVTLLFRAWNNTKQEVKEPLDRLMEWSLPQMISNESSAILRTAQAATDSKTFIEAALPSVAPVCIAMKYKGMTYSPLVVESVGIPISSPVDAKGGYTEMQVPVTLCTLTAVDKGNWKKWGSS